MEIGSDFNVTTSQNKDNFFCLSGRTAIKLIIDKLTMTGEKCLIPNYLCSSIFHSISNFDYYKISNDLSIDYDNLVKLINNNKYKILFIINYFGHIDDKIVDIKQKCTENNILIVEDFTHNLYSKKLYGDISIASYRKSLPTPFGSIIVDKKNLLKSDYRIFFNLPYFLIILTKFFAMTLKNIKILKCIWRPILLFCEKRINNVSFNKYDYLNSILYKYYYDSKNHISQRHRNIDYLNRNLKIKLFEKFKNTYFTYPIFLESKTKRDLLREHLGKEKIYCPVYWPLDFDTCKDCNHYITDHILCIPIDQRYNETHMGKIVTSIHSFYNIE